MQPVVHAVTGLPLMSVPVQICMSTIPMIVDTGASISLLPLQCVNPMSLKPSSVCLLIYEVGCSKSQVKSAIRG